MTQQIMVCVPPHQRANLVAAITAANTPMPVIVETDTLTQFDPREHLITISDHSYIDRAREHLAMKDLQRERRINSIVQNPCLPKRFKKGSKR